MDFVEASGLVFKYFVCEVRYYVTDSLLIDWTPFRPLINKLEIEFVILGYLYSRRFVFFKGEV